MCRNVPFQATRKEILQLIGAFGQLKKVHLPKKFDGQHRGFAFVEFLTGQESVSAMTALSQTHLYGRHVVLEWASDNDEIDLLREKAKRDVEPVKDVPKNKKIKFNDDKSGRQQGDCWISNAGWTQSFPVRYQFKLVPRSPFDIAGSGFAANNDIASAPLLFQSRGAFGLQQGSRFACPDRQSDRKDPKDLEDSTHASVTGVHSMHLIHTF